MVRTIAGKESKRDGRWRWRYVGACAKWCFPVPVYVCSQLYSLFPSIDWHAERLRPLTNWLADVLGQQGTEVKCPSLACSVDVLESHKHLNWPSTHTSESGEKYAELETAMKILCSNALVMHNFNALAKILHVQPCTLAKCSTSQ